MAEGTIVVPPDSTGKATRTMTGGANQPASTHQPVSTLALPDGTLVGIGAGALPTVDPDASTSGTINATDVVVAAPAGTGALLTGTSTAGSYVSLACPGGDAAWIIQLTGSFGGGTVYFEESVDSTNGINGNWIAVNGRQTGVINTVLLSGTTVAGFFRGNTSGATYVRARIVGATAPSVAVVMRISSGTGAIFLNASIPGGTNTIGTVDTELPAASALADDMGTPTTPVVGAAGMLWDGATWDRFRSMTVGTTPGVAQVNLAGSAGLVAAIVGTVTATATAAATGTASTTAIVLANVTTAGNATVTLAGGTYTALTLAFEGCPESTGTYWFPLDGSRTDGSGVDIQPSYTSAAVRAWNVICPGYYYIRVRVVAITQTVAPTIIINQGPFLYDPSPTVAPIDGQKATFSAWGTSTLNAASDIITVTGSATRTVRITRVELGLGISAATTTTGATVRLAKRSAANTGGTSAAATYGSYDSGDTARTATSLVYSAAATSLGAVAAYHGVFRVNGAAISAWNKEWKFGDRSHAPVLRGTAELFAVYLPAAIPGTSQNASWEAVVEWTEE